MRKKIILTYDYELFFGLKSGTVLHTLIEPTNYLLDAMDKYGQKGNFFVDWMTLKYLKEANTGRTLSDYELIEEQLKDMVKRGHRIELHIHPHWVDAKYNGDGTWNYDNYSHYSLTTFTEEQIIDMFTEGVNLLTAIARTVDPKYTIVAFRAGGWTVQPFEKLKQAFRKAGIKVDSSVSIGSYRETPYYYFDFRNVSVTSKHIYRFDNDVTKEVKDGEFIEVPISSYHRDFWNQAIDKFFRTFFKSSKVITDGTHKRTDLPSGPKTDISMVTMSRMCPISVLRGATLANANMITLIDHPKDFSKSNIHCLKLLSKKYQTTTYLQLLQEYL